MQIGGEAQRSDQRQGRGARARRKARPRIESGPDPDGPGVEVNRADDPEPTNAELAAAAAAAASDSDATDDDDAREPVGVATRPRLKGKGLESRPSRQLNYSAPGEDGAAQKAAKKSEDPYANTSRNAPCPCGSGKKFKLCHGKPGA